MKKITLLFICVLLSFTGMAQDNDPTFTWTNMDDYMIGGQLIVKPGDVINYTIDYSIGVSGGNDDTFWFILFAVQKDVPGADVIDGQDWETIPAGGESYPGEGDGTTVSGSFTVPADAELTSAGNFDYRVLTYLAYYEGGDTNAPQFGEPDVNVKVPVAIMSQEEINALSLNDFELNQGFKIYPNPVKDLINVSTNQVFETIEIRNVLGQLISTKAFDNTVDVSDLKAGVYFIGVDNNYIRFIKE